MEKNTIIINKRVAVFSKNIEVNGDVIVPDIKPDILSIINENGNAYIYREDITSGRIRVDGNLDTFTVYLSDSGETRSIGSTLNFSESFEDGRITDGCRIKSKVLLTSIDGKVLNERKISIKAVLKITVEVYSKEEVQFGLNFEEIENAENIQKLEETVNTKSLIGSNKVKTSIKEDINVDPSYDIAEILRVNVSISNLENKISYNKVLAKADANVRIMFLAEDGRIGIQNTTIPVMSFIDIEGVEEGQECDTQYFIRNMLFKVNSKEMHSITCQIDFEVSLDVYENKTFEVIEDMYGIRNNVNFDSNKVTIPMTSNNIKEKVTVSENILIEDILSIYDIESYVNILNSNQNNVECEVYLKIYYEADSRSGLNCKEAKIPFIVRLNNPVDNLDFEIESQQYTIVGENVNFNIVVSYSQADTKYKDVNIINNVSVNDLEQDEDYKMFMYFVKEGDTIWKIAKRFRTNMDDIIKLNNLENPDRINIGDRLFIMR